MASRRKLNPNFGRGSSSSSLQAIYARARTSGSLKLVGRQLSEIPKEVYDLLEQSSLSSDEKWWECTPLKSVDLSNNEIVTVSDDIGKHEELEVFIVRSNKLSELPVSLTNIVTLQRLVLFDNNLEVLPPIEGAVNLLHLDVAKNRLVELPHLGHLSKLTHLSADFNERLSRLPDELPSSLVTLTVTNCQLTVVPDCVGSLRNLEKFDCSFNRLKSCPSLEGCTRLKVICMATNQLTQCPKLPTSGTLSEVNLSANGLRDANGIAECLSASVVLLNDNGIRELPASIAKLPLRILDVSNNNLNDVPSELGRIGSLNKLLMSGNFLRKLKRSATTLGIEKLKKYLRSRLGEEDEENAVIGPIDVNLALRDASASHELVLADAELCELPDGAVDLELRSVNLRGNQFTTLSSDIVRWCDTLQTLVLDNNKLVDLCPEVGQLVHLRELSVRENSLSALPPLQQLRRLRTLDLRNNKFSEFPLGVLEVPSIRVLYLGHNSIRRLPNVNSLVELGELDVSSNRISNIDDGLRYNQRLTVLNLENNSLSAIPLEVGVMDQLKSLMIGGNSLRTIPYDKQRGTTDKLLAFLRRRIPEDSPLLDGMGEAPDRVEQGDIDTSHRDALKKNIAELSRELEENLSLSNAKKFALKKQLAKEKAALIREERRLKAL